MSTTVRNGLVNAEEAQVNKIKPNSGTSVTIQDADGNDRLTVDGDGVTIAGTTTTVDVATVTVDDKNVEINAVASPTDANADGGGLTLKGSTDKTILWENDDDSWHFNQGVVVAGMAHATLVEGSLSQGNIQVGVDSGGDPGGELMFHTDDYVGLRCANSGAVSLAVKPSGNVGIGTTEPAVALDVIGTGSFAGAAASLSQGNVQVGVDSGGDPGGELMFHTDDYVGLRCAHSGALPLAVKPSGNVGIGDVAPGTQLQMSGTAPYLTLKNSTAENTAGGCESKIIFEDHADVTLAQVEGSHSGSSDDTKGKLILSTHTGSALTAALTIDDGQDATFSGDITTEGSVLLKEKTAAIADTAAYGQLWVKDSSPAELYFTSDAGDDIQITDGTALASSGSGDITAVSLTGDSGGALNVASGAAGFTIAGGSGITTSGSSTTITIAGDDATTSAKGVCSFSSTDFSVSSGAVSLAKGQLMTSSVRFWVGATANDRVYFPYNPDNQYPLKFGQYLGTSNIPAAGSSLSGTASLIAHEGPEYLAQFVAPVAVRLVGMAVTAYLTNPDNGAHYLRLGAMKSVFTDLDDYNDQATWTTLGLLDTTSMDGTDYAGIVVKKTATFSSSDGDVAAGEAVGIVAESVGDTGDQVGAVQGTVTMTFEVQ